MFDNIKSIKRILCPKFNNFKKYSSVINSVVKNENIIIHAFILKIKILKYRSLNFFIINLNNLNTLESFETLLFYDLFWFE